MHPALDWRTVAREPGWIAAVSAAAVTWFFARVLGLLDVTETDLLHGHPYITVATLGACLILAAPARSRGTRAKILHGIILGSCLWWTCYFLIGADLLARNDLTFAALLTVAVAGVIASLGGASLVITAIFELWLKQDRRGTGPLQALELLLFGSLSQANQPGQPALLAIVLGYYFRVRRAIGRETTRSHAIEKAFESSLDSASHRLRHGLDTGAVEGITLRVNEVADAAAAELSMFELLRRFRPELPVAPLWPARLVKAWDLIRGAEWITQTQQAEARCTLLGRLSASSVISRWLRAAARSVLDQQITPQSIRQLDQHIRPDATGEELFGCALLFEGLIDAQLATWSVDFLERQNERNPPAWIVPTFSRIRMQAEAQMLQHEGVLGPEETAIRRAHYSCLVLQADIAGLDQTTRATLVRPLQTLSPTETNRSTNQIPPLRREGFDLGTGATPIALVAAVALAFVNIVWVYRRPLGPAIKPLVQLSGKINPAGHLIAASDATPEGNLILMATRGDGLHQLNTDTFRLRSHRPDNGGPSSLWLSDVATSQTGQTGVVTYIPSADGKGDASSGVDVETAAGWIPIIRPTGIRPPIAEKITHIVRVGSNKLIREDSRWLFYRSATRELGEMSFSGLPETKEGKILFVSGRATGTAHAFVIVRGQISPKQPTHDQIFELEPGTDTNGKATDITGTFPASEKAAQLVAGDKELWIRTESKRLYERENGLWKMRLDGDTGLASERIVHAVLSSGPIATLWLVEAGDDGQAIRVRARPLPESDYLPKSAWRIFDLTTSTTTAERRPTADALRLNSADSAPVAVFDPVRKQSTLLVAGRFGGLWRFSCNPDAPPSPSGATLECELIPTPGERLLSVDAGSGAIVSVLESEDGFSRRVTVNRVVGAQLLGLDASTTVLESFLPDPTVLAGANILLAANSAKNRLLHLVLDSGRILTWDRLKHGFTSRSGSQALDANGRAIGRLLSADFRNGKILFTDDQGRVLAGAESEINATSPSFSVLHQARVDTPPTSLFPLHVATQNQGLDVFFGPQGSDAGEPWYLGPTGLVGNKSGPALISWSKSELSEKLKIGTLTRIQTKNGFENIVALGESGKLFWRNDAQWMPWSAEAGSFTALHNALGGTFASSAQEIRQIGIKDGAPYLGYPVWKASAADIALPISAMAGLEADERMLLVGHANGLALYFPEKRRWQAVAMPSKSPRPANWTFLSTESSAGTSHVVWAVERVASGEIRQINRVQRTTATNVEISTGSSAVMAGDLLAVWDNNQGLRTEEPGGNSHGLIPAKSPGVGDAQLRRIAGTKLLHALDHQGRLLTANPADLTWKLASTAGLAQSFLDIDTDTGDRLYLLNTKGMVLRREPLGVRDMQIAAAGLHQIGEGMGAFDLTRGTLSLLDASGTAERVAGGKNTKAVMGREIRASLADGDTLFLAGPEGAIFRGFRRAQFAPIPDSAGITRFEKIGADLFAYRGGEVNRLVEERGDYLLERIAGNNDSVITGPDGKVWVGNSTAGLTAFVPTSPTRAQAVGSLFKADGRIAAQLRQAAPWKSDSVILPGSDGQLLHYHPALRSFSTISGFEQMPKDWELLRSGNLVVVKFPNANGRASLHLVSDAAGPKLVQLESAALDVVQRGASVAWISSSDWSVRQIDEGATRTLLSFQGAKPTNDKQDQISQMLVAQDGTFWAVAGKTAFQYSVSKQSILRTVPSVSTLARDGVAVVAVTESASGPAVTDLSDQDLTSSTAVSGVGIGENTLLKWRETRAARTTVLGQKTVVSNVRLPASLGKQIGSPVSVPNTSLLAWLSERGELVTYDTAYGRWDKVANDGAPWAELGLAGNALILHRKSPKAAIGVLTLDRQISLQEAPPGSAWFTSDGWTQIRQTDVATLTVVVKAPTGTEQPLRAFTRATSEFRGEHSGAFEDPALGAALLLLKKSEPSSPEISLVRGTGPALIMSTLPTPARPDSLKVFTDSLGFVVNIDGGLFRISTADGHVEKIGDNVLDVGLVGNQLHFLEKDADSSGEAIKLRRLADKTIVLDLGTIIHKLEHRTVLRGRFREHSGQGVLEIETRLAEGNETSTSTKQNLPLVVIQKLEGLTITDASSITEPVSNFGALRYIKGTNEGITVFKQRLAQDGWFDAQYPIGFEPGTLEADRLPLRMRNQTILPVPMKSPVTPSPNRRAGAVTLVGNQLQHATSAARFGSRSAADSLFECDEWRDARPTSEATFVTLDALSQVWHWKIDQQGFRRELVVVPVGIPVTGFRLPTVADGSVLLIDAKNKTVGQITNGKFSTDQVSSFVATPAERAGKFKALNWSKTGANPYFRMTLTAVGRDGNETIALDFSSAGLSVDRPLGLIVLPGDTNLWIRLKSLPDGRLLICPLDQDGANRLTACRLIMPPAPPTRTGFSVGAFQFSPKADGWNIHLGDTKVDVSNLGRLAIDEVRHAATITSENSTTLFLETAQPGAIIKQRWISQNELGEATLIKVPAAISELRTWNGEIHLRTSDDRWMALRASQWVAAAPDWAAAKAAPSRWSFDSRGNKITWNGEEVPVTNIDGAFALAADIFSPGTAEDGSPQVCAPQGNEVIYKSISGDWFAWKSGFIVGRRANPPPPPVKATLTLGSLTLPRRNPSGGEYVIRGASMKIRRMPLSVRDGRMPHQDVTKIESWGPTGFRAQLNNDLGYLIFEGDSRKGTIRPTFEIASTEAVLPTPRYDLHTSMQLSPEVSVNWQKANDSFDLLLRTIGSTSESPLGPLTPLGFEIDNPTKIRPIAVTTEEIRFMFREALWTRKVDSSLTNFRRVPSSAPANAYGLVFDPASGTISLGTQIGGDPVLTSPWSGRFSRNGRYAKNESFEASLEGSARLTAMVLNRREPQPVTLRITRSDSGWIMPFTKPIAAFSEDDCTALVSNNGDWIGYFDPEGHLRRTDRLTKPVTHLWRANESMLGTRSDGAIVKFSLGKDGATNESEISAETAAGIEGSAGMFSLRRSPQTGDLKPVWKAAGDPIWRLVLDWQTQGFPGTKLQSVALANQDSLLLADRWGIRRFNLTANTVQTAMLSNDGTTEASLGRNFGEIELRKKGLIPQFASLDDTESGIHLQSDTKPRQMGVGKWLITQTPQTRRIAFQFQTESGVLTILNSAGGLDFDSNTGIFEIGSDRWASSRAGFVALSTGQFIPAFNQDAQSILARQDLRLTIDSGEPAVFSSASNEIRVNVVPGLPVRKGARGTDEYSWIGAENDWRVYVTHKGALTISRQVMTEQGSKNDILAGNKIFSGNQMAFDHARTIHRDPAKPSDLLLVTSRAIERISARQPNATSVVDLKSDTSRPLAWRNISYSNSEKREFQIGDEKIRLPKSEQPGSAQIFNFGSRIWIIEENTVRWIESGKRWRTQREIDLTPKD